jgi:hypothetical protein
MTIEVTIYRLQVASLKSLAYLKLETCNLKLATL